MNRETYLSRDFESETGVTDESGLGLLETSLPAEEDGFLFLESSLVLCLRGSTTRGTWNGSNKRGKRRKKQNKNCKTKNKVRWTQNTTTTCEYG
jgi:hypothetical protein